MANDIKLKRSATQGKVPTTAQLQLGELALNTYDGKLYTKKNDGADAVVEIGRAITVSATAPSNPDTGDLWYDTVDARTFIWTGSEWADSSPDAGFPTTATGDSAPANPESGDLWYRTSDGRMYVYYNDGDTSQWVDTNPNTTPVNDTFERTGTDVTLVNTGDNVGIGTTPAVKLDVNGEIRASTGVLFGTDTATANTLDDYEEGTWTGGIEGGSTAGSYSVTSSTFHYVKIGRQVTATYNFIAISENSAGTGNLKVTGLPFVSTADSSSSTYGTVVLANANVADTTVSLASGMGISTDELNFQETRDNANSTQVQITDLDYTGTPDVKGTITYFTDA